VAFVYKEKNTMNITEELNIIQLTTQQDLRVPTPAECASLLEQARASGIAVNELYVLSAPLSPRSLGGFVREGASIWVLYDQQRTGSLDQSLRCELYALAQAERPKPPVISIDDDWDEVRRLWMRASKLARLWGWERLFPEEELNRLLEETEVLRWQHVYAGYLAGSLVPAIARAAYDALCAIREREGWSSAEFGEVLANTSEDGSRDGLVLDFDRCYLRRSWRQPFRPEHSFGPLAQQSTLRSDRLLRSALSHCAEHPTDLASLRWHPTGSEETYLCFLQVEDDQDFAAAIGALNALLLHDEVGIGSVLVTWHCYGESARIAFPPVYRLVVNWSESGEEAGSERHRSREVWILFASRKERQQYLEWALQRYITSWQAWTSFQFETTREGMEVLWSWLK
jgi:hypothetical protein